MTDKEFDLLLKNSITKHFSEYIPESELDYTPHEFSAEFENKMAKLLGKPQKIKHTFSKKTVTIILVAIITACVAAFAIGANRNIFSKFFVKFFSDHSEIQPIYSENAPTDFSDKYEITMELSDFTLVDIYESVFNRTYRYEKEYYQLYFQQEIKEEYNPSVNTEGYEIEQVSINGFDGLYLDMYNQSSKSIVWDNGDYIFTLVIMGESGYEFSKDELIEIAESVQKVE